MPQPLRATASLLSPHPLVFIPITRPMVHQISTACIYGLAR